MHLIKIFCFSILFFAIMSKVNCQNRLDSIELELKSIKYIFVNKNSATGKVPPQSIYVHCMITCNERKHLETITNAEWIALMGRNSSIGLIVTALLHDLFKETAVVFMHTESQDAQKWQDIYWKSEIKSWENYLKNKKYKFIEGDCFELD